MTYYYCYFYYHHHNHRHRGRHRAFLQYLDITLQFNNYVDFFLATHLQSTKISSISAIKVRFI